MVDVNYGGWTHHWANSVLHQMLGGWTPSINGYDQTVHSRNYCYSSTSVEITDEVNPAIVFILFCFQFLCVIRLRVLILKKTRSRLC